MKHVLILLLGALMLLLMRRKKEYRIKILCSGLILIAGVNLFLSVRDLPKLVPFTRSTNQMFYQPQYLSEGTYPDAILPLMISGKTIRTKDDIREYTFDLSDPDAPWENLLHEVYYGVNSRNLLESMGANVVADQGLNDVVIRKEAEADFESLGMSNDMYRFSFPFNDFPGEYANSFHYYCYYTAFGLPMQVRIPKGDAQAFLPDSTEDLVAIWERIPEGFGEQLYLMSRSYYEKEVAR